MVEYLKTSINFKMYYKKRLQTTESKKQGKTNNVIICLRRKTHQDKIDCGDIEPSSWGGEDMSDDLDLE